MEKKLSDITLEIGPGNYRTFSSAKIFKPLPPVVHISTSIDNRTHSSSCGIRQNRFFRYSECVEVEVKNVITNRHFIGRICENLKDQCERYAVRLYDPYIIPNKVIAIPVEEANDPMNASDWYILRRFIFS